MSKKIVAAYAHGSKLFHWLIAVIVIFMLSFSFFLSDLAEQYQPLAYTLHKSFGLTVLIIMLARFFWIHHRGKPILPLHLPRWERLLAKWVQFSLYFFLFAMPMSGWILSVAENRVPSFFGLFRMPLPLVANKELAEIMDQTHKAIAGILIALIVLHVLGALKHYFIDKDRILQRMWRG